MSEPLIGQPIKRVEDPRLLRGEGRYVDDVHPDGCLHAVFVRSQHAHAMIGSIDLSATRTFPGVVDIVTAADLGKVKSVPVRAMIEGAHAIGAPLLAGDRVRYVGEPVAVVVGDTRDQADEAARAIDIDY